MELYFTCRSCQKRLKVKGSAMGSQVDCPGCNTPTEVPRSDFAPGTRIAGFEIVRPLGKGGMGEVYLARQLSMGREIALKVLSAEFAARPGAVERFVKEVHVAAKLEHPHIVAAYDAGKDDGLHYMAMSFVPGQSLSAMLKPGAVLSEREALAMIRKLAQALDYAWSSFRIIHRDIKPANILFDAKGEPKLADMGLSKSLDDAEAMTMSGAVMGTPNYMSPEQAEGRSDLDFRVDVYSLGATLYHAVTGEMPFSGSSIMAVLRKQAVEALPDPREFNPQLSEHFVGLLQIMLAKNPADRYADWKTLIHDIDFVLDSKPPSVAVPGEGKSVLIRNGRGPSHPRKIVIPKEGLHVPHAPAAPAPRPKPAMKPRDKALVFGGAAALGLAVMATVLAMNLSKQRAEDRRAQTQRETQLRAQQSAEALARDAQAAKEKAQAGIWQVAADFAAANPDELDRAIANYEDAGKQLAGTKYELMAKNEIARIREARTGAIQKALAELETRAKELADRKDFDAAAEVFAKYQGTFAADLAKQRIAQEQKYRTFAVEAAAKLTEAERAGKEAERAVIAAAADAVYAGDLAKAQQACRAFVDDPAIAIDKAEVKRIAGWLDQVAMADKTLLATFETQKGKTIQLALDGAKAELRISGVRGDRIQVEQKKGVGWAGAELSIAQVPLDEQHARLKDKLDPAALGLWAGSLMLKAKRPDLATKQFQAAGPLATALLAKTEGAKTSERESAAQVAFAQALQAAGLPAVGLQPETIAERLKPGQITVAQAAAALRQFEAYAAAFGDTQHAQSSALVLAALRPALEAAQKGVAPPVLSAAAPRSDDFAKRVFAARACTGEVIRCSPEGGDGALAIGDAVQKLRRGMILHVLPGTYQAVPCRIPVEDVVIEGEPGARYAGTLALQFPPGGLTIVRSLAGGNLLVGTSKDTRGNFTVVDCSFANLTIFSDTLRLFNCWLGYIWLGGDADTEIRHCTIHVRRKAQDPQVWFQSRIRQCLISDSLFWNDDAPPLVAGHGFERAKVVLKRCVAGSPSGISAALKPGGGSYHLFKDLSAFPEGMMKDCVTASTSFLDDSGRRLRAGAPGRGIAAGGRDPGALVDEQGNILSLDPIVPALATRTAPALPPLAVPGAKTALKDMVLIPAGEFQMGDTFGEGEERERPVHKVTVSAFYMDKYEVTKSLWDEMHTWAETHGYDFGTGSGKAAEHPVCNVNWYAVVKWCNARSEKEGLTPCYTVTGSVYRTGQFAPDCTWSADGYRLPTEAEWEKAARGGAAGRQFPWADADTITHGRANYASSSNYAYDVSSSRGFHPTYSVGSHPFTSPVGSFPTNGYGLFDMAGNVREWCWDWQGSYPSRSQTDPRGQTTGAGRVRRGGCWSDNAWLCRAASRSCLTPLGKDYYLGFRSVRAASQ